MWWLNPRAELTEKDRMDEREREAPVWVVEGEVKLVEAAEQHIIMSNVRTQEFLMMILKGRKFAVCMEMKVFIQCF